MMKKVYGLVLLGILSSATFAGDNDNEELPSSGGRDTPRNRPPALHADPSSATIVDAAIREALVRVSRNPPPPLLIGDDDGVELEGFSFTEDDGIVPNDDSPAVPAFLPLPVTIDDDKYFQTACKFIGQDNMAAVAKLRIAFGYPASLFTADHKKALLVKLAQKIPRFESIGGQTVLITAERLFTTYKATIDADQIALIDQYLNCFAAVSQRASS